MADDTGGSSRWTVYQIIIAIVMVVTGSVNTLAAKWADRLKDHEGIKFDHPFLQAVCMFIGEFSCLIAFILLYAWQKYQYNKSANAVVHDLGPIDSSQEVQGPQEPPKIPRFNPLIFLPAALCDMCATSTMYFGLNMTSAGSFQMLRGAVIIFTGLFSVIFLRSRLFWFKWIGMGFVVLGLAVVGLADIFFGEGDKHAAHEAIIGDGLIVVAQVIVACQMVYEQKFVLKYDVHPLLAVGLEGLFGMLILSALLVPFYWIPMPGFVDSNSTRLEDVPMAFCQMGENWRIILALSGTIVSIAFFNFAGISVTKELSATTRMVLDSVRTIIIWTISLALVWQDFEALQILGFILLILGMFIYNDVLIGPAYRDIALPYAEERGHPPPLWFYTCCGVEGIAGTDERGATPILDDDEPLPEQNGSLEKDPKV